jgi:hypothetical protein
VKISGLLDDSFMLCSLFIVFLRTIQAAAIAIVVDNLSQSDIVKVH